MNELERQLMQAAKDGEIVTVRRLIAQGVNVNVRDEDEATPLMHAADSYHRDVIILLIQNGADVNARDKNDNTALIKFCLNIGDDPENLDTLSALFTPTPSGEKLEVDIQNKEGATALHLCLDSGNAEIAERLLLGGANPNVKDNEGISPLMLAFEKNFYDGMDIVINRLIDIGADVNAKDNKEMTALMRSALCEDLEIIQKILDYGNRGGNKIDVNTADDEGDTALILAAKAGNQNSAHQKIIYLLSEGADINHKNNDGKTALDIAEEEGHQRIVRILKSSSKAKLRESLKGVDLKKAAEEIAGSMYNPARSKPDSPEGQKPKRKKTSKKARGV